MKKVALFDVDYTILNCDSMFKFLWYSIKKKPILIFYLPVIAVYLFLYAVKLVSTSKAKEKLFVGINYMDENDLKDFYELVLKKCIFNTAIDSLKSRKEEGCYVLLITASPNAYLKYFKDLEFVDDVIGTSLQIKDGFYTNKIIGNNCKGEEKVKQILNHLNSKNIEIDFENSYAYSDSKSDMPMMKLVKNRYLVNKRTGELTDYIIE